MPAEDNPGAGRAAGWVRGPLPWALRVGLWWCGVELGWTLYAGPSAPRALAVWLALGLCLVPVTAVGLLAQLGARLSRWDPLGRGRAGWGAALGSFVRDGDAATQRWRAARLLAFAGALGLYCGLAFLATERLVVEMAQPRFSALSIGGAHLVALGVAALAYPALCGPAAFVVRGLARLPRVGASLSSVRGLLWWAAAVGLLGGGAGLYAQRELAAFLPWRSVLPALCALIFASLAGSLRPRLSGRIQRGLGLAVLLVSAVTLGGTLLLGPAQAGVRREAVGFSHGARLGAELIERLLDFDADGQVHVMGGGDCAPFDARRHPGAVDLPDNGSDEDCDGSDLVLARIAKEQPSGYALPDTLPAHPPIVLLTIDAFAARRLAALGGKRGVTPNIDALAERSALFTACFSQGPSTRLSFPSIFTSRWDSQIRRTLVGKHPYPLEPGEKLLAQYMTRAGYDTAAVVSDTYFSKARWSSLMRGFNRVVESPFRSAGRAVHNSTLVTDAAIAELNRARKQPLFLWLHYYDAHSPHQQPVGGKKFGRAREDVYDAELALVDQEVGRFVAALRKRLPDALLVLSADHGIAFDEPRHEQLNYGYDLNTVTLHVPLLFNAPFVPARQLDGLVGTMDIAPTLAALARVRGKLPFEGVALWPELLEGKRQRPARLIHEFFITERRWKAEDPLEIISLRTDRYNLIHDRRDGSYQLYEWRTDYLETNELSELPEHRAELGALKQQLAAYTYRLYDPRDNPPASPAVVRK
jgi:arylsulfatase A-like enzyme